MPLALANVSRTGGVTVWRNQVRLQRCCTRCSLSAHEAVVFGLIEECGDSSPSTPQAGPESMSPAVTSIIIESDQDKTMAGQRMATTSTLRLSPPLPVKGHSLIRLAPDCRAISGNSPAVRNDAGPDLDLDPSDNTASKEISVMAPLGVDQYNQGDRESPPPLLRVRS